MPVHNREIAGILNELADLQALRGENEFRIRSYRNAARTISGYTGSITEMAENGEEIQSLPGIGQSMAAKIEEIARTGTLSQLEELRKQVPATLMDIMKLEQMGPQRTREINEKLKVETIEDLRKAALDGRVEKLKGFGKKTSENILREIDEYSKKGGSKRVKFHDAGELIAPLLKYLDEKLDDITVAGSYRRKKETVGDIDILATARNRDEAMDHFVNYEEVRRILAKGESKSSVKLRADLQVDLRIFDRKTFGAALIYFTGSKAHNIALRKIGIEKGYKINEYGVYRGKKLIAGETEEDIYKKLGLNYIEPELREDAGEIEAAGNGHLPDLITPDDIRGDLHTHTNATDGKYPLADMVRAAAERGYEYYAIADHSKRVAMAKGLDEKRLAEQISEIDGLNKKMKGIRILKSIEVDILEDGSLDLPGEILKELDLVVCAAHYNTKLPRKKQTRRIIKAMENPYFNILAHPTGRMIGKRDGLDIDMEQVLKEAAINGCFMEINCNPDRLDLNDRNIRMAREHGVKLAISTDAHSIASLDYMKYGVDQARRGWLEKDDVINTRPWKELKKLLKRG